MPPATGQHRCAAPEGPGAAAASPAGSAGPKNFVTAIPPYYSSNPYLSFCPSESLHPSAAGPQHLSLLSSGLGVPTMAQLSPPYPPVDYLHNTGALYPSSVDILGSKGNGFAYSIDQNKGVMESKADQMGQDRRRLSTTSQSSSSSAEESASGNSVMIPRVQRVAHMSDASAKATLNNRSTHSGQMTESQGSQAAALHCIARSAGQQQFFPNYYSPFTAPNLSSIPSNTLPVSAISAFSVVSSTPPTVLADPFPMQNMPGMPPIGPVMLPGGEIKCCNQIFAVSDFMTHNQSCHGGAPSASSMSQHALAAAAANAASWRQLASTVKIVSKLPPPLPMECSSPVSSVSVPDKRPATPQHTSGPAKRSKVGNRRTKQSECNGLPSETGKDYEVSSPETPISTRFKKSKSQKQTSSVLHGHNTRSKSAANGASLFSFSSESLAVESGSSRRPRRIPSATADVDTAASSPLGLVTSVKTRLAEAAEALRTAHTSLSAPSSGVTDSNDNRSVHLKRRASIGCTTQTIQGSMSYLSHLRASASTPPATAPGSECVSPNRPNKSPTLSSKDVELLKGTLFADEDQDSCSMSITMDAGVGLCHEDVSYFFGVRTDDKFGNGSGVDIACGGNLNSGSLHVPPSEGKLGIGAITPSPSPTSFVPLSADNVLGPIPETQQAGSKHNLDVAAQPWLGSGGNETGLKEVKVEDGHEYEDSVGLEIWGGLGAKFDGLLTAQETADEEESLSIGINPLHLVTASVVDDHSFLSFTTDDAEVRQRSSSDAMKKGSKDGVLGSVMMGEMPSCSGPVIAPVLSPTPIVPAVSENDGSIGDDSVMMMMDMLIKGQDDDDDDIGYNLDGTEKQPEPSCESDVQHSPPPCECELLPSSSKYANESATRKRTRHCKKCAELLGTPQVGSVAPAAEPSWSEADLDRDSGNDYIPPSQSSSSSSTPISQPGEDSDDNTGPHIVVPNQKVSKGSKKTGGVITRRARAEMQANQKADFSTGTRSNAVRESRRKR